MDPDRVLALFRSFARDDQLHPASALLDLIDVLARTHATMDSGEWEIIATVGALLWRAEMEGVEAQGESEMLMRRLRGGG